MKTFFSFHRYRWSWTLKDWSYPRIPLSWNWTPELCQANFCDLENYINLIYPKFTSFTVYVILYYNGLYLYNLFLFKGKNILTTNPKIINHWFCLYFSLAFQQKFYKWCLPVIVSDLNLLPSAHRTGSSEQPQFSLSWLTDSQCQKMHWDILKWD